MHTLYDANDLSGHSYHSHGTRCMRRLPQHQDARRHLQCRSVKSKIPVASISNQTIPGPDGNKIPIRIYYPADAKLRKKGLPILVFCHGGGFFAGDLDTYDDLCRNLGHLSAYIVISVDYRYVSHLLSCCMAQLSAMHQSLYMMTLLIASPSFQTAHISLCHMFCSNVDSSTWQSDMLSCLDASYRLQSSACLQIMPPVKRFQSKLCIILQCLLSKIAKPQPASMPHLT